MGSAAGVLEVSAAREKARAQKAPGANSVARKARHARQRFMNMRMAGMSKKSPSASTPLLREAGALASVQRLYRRRAEEVNGGEIVIWRLCAEADAALYSAARGH